MPQNNQQKHVSQRPCRTHLSQSQKPKGQKQKHAATLLTRTVGELTWPSSYSCLVLTKYRYLYKGLLSHAKRCIA